MIYGQNQKYLLIQVLDDKNISISDANIFLQDTLCEITNINGFANISLIKKNIIKITIKHLAFETKDTLVNVQNQQVKLTIKLKPLIYEIEEITVSSKEHITDYKNHNFSDIYLIENQICALFSKSDQAYLKFYDSLGNYNNLTYKFEQKGKFQSIEKGFVSGQYYLVGKDECIPFICNQDMPLLEKSKLSREIYDKIYKDVLFFKDSKMIKCEMTEYRNKADIYDYDTNDLSRKLIWSVYDKEKAKDARYNYNKIRSMYLNGLNNPNELDIDFGFERQDITKNPNWNGDIFDLIVTRKQLIYYSFFQVASDGISIASKVNGINIYFLDNTNKEILKAELPNIKIIKKLLLSQGDKSKYNFMLTNKRVCLENGNTYICLDEDLFLWNSLIVDKHAIYFPKRKILIDKHIFILGRKSIDVVNSQVFMLNFKD